MQELVPLVSGFAVGLVLGALRPSLRPWLGGLLAVVLAGHSVDAYNPKTVRATAGSLFHLPIAVEPSVEAAVRAAKQAGLTVLAADGAGETGLYDAPMAGPTAWLFGNEAWGLPADVAALADHRVRIPIHGRAESLNLATAAAVCLYASARGYFARACRRSLPAALLTGHRQVLTDPDHGSLVAGSRRLQPSLDRLGPL